MDFTNRYNTQLSPEDEAAFRMEWADKLGDLYDYDVRGAWKAYKNREFEFDDRGHGTDRFKKSDHPTFSDESMYHGVDGHIGGSWYNDGNGLSAYFAPLSHMYGMGDLAHYFKEVEPDTDLIDLRLMFGHLYGDK